MPHVVLVGKPGSRWDNVAADLRGSTGWEVVVADAPLAPQLDSAGFQGGVLVGAGDGVALVTEYAGGFEDHRVWGLALLSPRFVEGAADLREALGYIRVPILLVQPAAEGDTQANIAQEECYCPVDVVRVDGSNGVTAAITEFVTALALTRTVAEPA
jgi:hypothetical protein